jgi:hypothetical protein
MACTLDAYYSWTLPSPRVLSSLDQDDPQEPHAEKDGTEDEPCQIARKLLFDCWKQDHSPPSGNLWKGGLGTYFVLLEYALKRGNTKSIYKSKHYLMKACEAAQHAVNEYESRIEGTTDRCHKHQEHCISILQSEWVGAKALLGICQWHLGEQDLAMALLNDIFDQILKKASHASTKHNNTLLSGRAGALQALFWVRKELKDPYWRTETAVELAKQILQGGTVPTPCNASGTAEAPAFHFCLEEDEDGEDVPVSSRSAPPDQLFLPSPNTPSYKPRRSRHQHNRNGASKGQIGILHSLVNLSTTEWNLLEEQVPGCKQFVQTKLDSLTLQGNYINWAHGATSLALLWIRASQVFQSKAYLLQACQLCESTIWPKATKAQLSIGLAKGQTGIAFLCLSLAECCEKPISTLWQRRAEFLARMALTKSPTDSSEKYSLYHGFAGLASLLLQLQQPRNHKIHMPLYGMGFPNEWLQEQDQLEKIALVEADVPDLPDSDGEDDSLVDSLEEILSKSWEDEEESRQMGTNETTTTMQTTPSRRPSFEKPHFLQVQTRQSFFWSLQTDSNIGNSEEYRPALVNTTPKMSHTKPPMTPRSITTPSPTSKSGFVASSTKKKKSVSKKSKTQNRRQSCPLPPHTPKTNISTTTIARPPTTPRSLPPTPRNILRRNSLPMFCSASCLPPTSPKSTPRRIQRTRETLLGSGGKVRLTRATILQQEAIASAALQDIVMPDEDVDLSTPFSTPRRTRSTQEALVGSSEKIRLTNAVLLKQQATPTRFHPKGNDSEQAQEMELHSPSSNAPQRTISTRATLVGSSGKVRLTRASILNQQSTPTTPYGDGSANSYPVVLERENLSKTPPRPCVRMSETLVGSRGKVRLTRAAILKQQSTPTPQQEVDHVVKVPVPRHSKNLPRIVSTRESLTGSGAKVRLTRSAILKQQATPVPPWNADHGGEGDSRSSHLQQRRSKSMTPLKISSEYLIGSGAKVRLTRSAKLKMISLEEDAKRAMEERELQRKFLPPLNLVYLNPDGPVTSDLCDEMGQPNDKVGKRIVKTIKYESFTPTNTSCKEKKTFFKEDEDYGVEKEPPLEVVESSTQKSTRDPTISSSLSPGMEIKAHAWQQLLQAAREDRPVTKGGTGSRQDHTDIIESSVLEDDEENKDTDNISHVQKNHDAMESLAASPLTMKRKETQAVVRPPSMSGWYHSLGMN